MRSDSGRQPGGETARWGKARLGLISGRAPARVGQEVRDPVVKHGRFRERSSLLAAITRGLDAFAIVAAGWIAYTIRMDTWVLPGHYQMALLLGGLFTLVGFTVLGAYHPTRGRSAWEQIRQALFAWGLVAAALMAVSVATQSSVVFSRQWMAWWLLIGAGGLAAGRIATARILRAMHERGWHLRRIVLAGAGAQAGYVIRRLREETWTGFQVEGVFPADPREAVGIPETPIHPLAELADFVERQRIAEVWLTLPAGSEHRIPDILHQLRHSAVGIRYVPGIQDLQLLNPAVSEVAGMAVLDLHSTPFQGINRIVKAIEDRLLAAVILLLISPLVLAIAIAVKLGSPGPVLFKQRRNGCDGRPIKVYKFRTMYVDQPEPDRVHQACRGDPRVTLVGRFLRCTSLDELPQFFNVLQGRMSIVGPRPHALEHNEYYKHRVEAYMRRHCVKPGITGWAQVNGYRGATDTIEQMEQRVAHDFWYIDNWSLWLDLRIIALTVVRMLRDRNAY